MNFDISTLCCNFLFMINRLIKFILKKMLKIKDASKKKPLCHFFLNSNSSIAIESSLKI